MDLIKTVMDTVTAGATLAIAVTGAPGLASETEDPINSHR
jgi:hypothetical protein